MSFARTLTRAACAAAVILTTVTVPAQAAPGDSSTATAEPAIIDGGYAKDAPWAARVFADGQQRCSGSIIAPRWVLTAHHCVLNVDQLSFRIGSLNQTQGEQARAVDGGVHTHPSGDLMLVKIDHPVQTEYARLGTRGDVQVNEKARIYGWGATCTDKPAEQCQSQRLKVAEVTVSGFDCKDHFKGPAICVTRGNGISANGDSGGPMFAQGAGGHVQVGLLSWSDDTKNAHYVRLAKYRDWISSVAGV